MNEDKEDIVITVIANSWTGPFHEWVKIVDVSPPYRPWWEENENFGILLIDS